MTPSKALKLVASGVFNKFTAEDWDENFLMVGGFKDPMIYRDDEITIIIAGEFIFCLNDDGETVFELGETE